MNQIKMDLIESFTSRTGKVVRVAQHDGEPIFCAKDLCEALGIVGHRVKVSKLDEDERVTYAQHTPSGKQRMLFVTEPGMYKITLTCRGATTKGTPAHAFTRWVTHEVLPNLRRDKEYKLRETLATETREEKSRRLWFVLKDMDLWSYNIRRRYFGGVCKATKDLCYVDEFGSPHVMAECLEECKLVMVLKSVPPDQTRLTQYWD